MKKRTIVFIAAILMTVLSVKGQIIYTSEDEGTHLRGGRTDPGFGVMVPLQNLQTDQWTETIVPLGGGLLILVGLGGAYLFKKRNENQ